MTDRPYWCEICARKKECYGITLKPKCFVPMADRKTENCSEKPNNCKDDKCNNCMHMVFDGFWYCECRECHYESEDEPQTDVYDYKGNGKWERSK